jgi:hypothetical protein
MSNKTSSDGPPREAPTPGTNPECANCGAYRCHHFGRAEYCNPTCLDRGEGATFRLRASGSGTTTARAPDALWQLVEDLHEAVAICATRGGTSESWVPVIAARNKMAAALAPLMGDAALGRALREALAEVKPIHQLAIYRSTRGGFRTFVEHGLNDNAPDVPVSDATRALAVALLSSPPGPSEARDG